ncbi:hypothetical protein BSLG_005086 [Batrachochytrium salamandrivorans]|nr:hypothetical protein BSLG_005086 [Batrachochytrium salamandrivorans]
MAAIPPTKPTVLPTAFPHIKYLCTKAFSRKRRRPSSAHLAPLSLSLLAAGLAHTASFRGSPTESLSESLSGALSGTLSESLSGALSGTLSESLSESLSGTLSSLVSLTLLKTLSLDSSHYDTRCQQQLVSSTTSATSAMSDSCYHLDHSNHLDHLLPMAGLALSSPSAVPLMAIENPSEPLDCPSLCGLDAAAAAAADDECMGRDATVDSSSTTIDSIMVDNSSCYTNDSSSIDSSDSTDTASMTAHEFARAVGITILARSDDEDDLMREMQQLSPPHPLSLLATSASTTNGMPDLASAATTTTTMPLFMKQRQQGMATDSVLLSSSPPASFSGYGGGDSTMSISSQLSSSCSSSRCSKYSSGPRLDMSIFEPPPHLLECAMSFNDSGFGSMTSSSSASSLVSPLSSQTLPPTTAMWSATSSDVSGHSATDSCSSTDSFSGHRTIRPFPHRAARYCSSNETMSAALPVVGPLSPPPIQHHQLHPKQQQQQQQQYQPPSPQQQQQMPANFMMFTGMLTSQTFVPRPKRALGHIRRHSDGPSALVPPRQATGSKSPLSTLDEFAQIHQKGRFTVVREQSSHWRPLQRRTVSRFLLVDEAAGDGDGVSESDADDTDACHDEDSNGLMTSEQASPKRQGRFRLGSQ